MWFPLDGLAPSASRSLLGAVGTFQGKEVTRVADPEDEKPEAPEGDKDAGGEKPADEEKDPE